MSELKISDVGIYTCETTGVSELSWDEGVCIDLGNDIDKESANTIYNCIKEHDQLVAENSRLREALKECIDELRQWQFDYEDFESKEFIALQENLLNELEGESK